MKTLCLLCKSNKHNVFMPFAHMFYIQFIVISMNIMYNTNRRRAI